MATTLSGFVRDLIDDHFNEHRILLSVGEETNSLYRKIISNTGATDLDLEPYFIEALKKMLKDRIKKMENLQKSLEKR